MPLRAERKPRKLLEPEYQTGAVVDGFPKITMFVGLLTSAWKTSATDSRSLNSRFTLTL